MFLCIFHYVIPGQDPEVSLYFEKFGVDTRPDSCGFGQVLGNSGILFLP